MNILLKIIQFFLYCTETLRKYPPLTFLSRICNKDYTIPETNLVVEKGIQVVIPVLGLHRDPNYFPDPEKFEPERFSDEAKRHRPNYVYLPFGEGQRICIGMYLNFRICPVSFSRMMQQYHCDWINQILGGILKKCGKSENCIQILEWRVSIEGTDRKIEKQWIRAAKVHSKRTAEFSWFGISSCGEIFWNSEMNTSRTTKLENLWTNKRILQPQERGYLLDITVLNLKLTSIINKI